MIATNQSTAGEHRMTVSEGEATQRWTCGNCAVEVRWAGSHQESGPPPNWGTNHGGPVCLHCRRELAGDAAVSGSDLSLKERARLRSSTIVEFEVRRTPDRSNTQIASAAHTNVGAVLKARKRLGVAATPG